MATSPVTPQTGAGVPRLLADYLVRQGADRRQLLAEVGLRPEDLAPGSRIPRGANQRLWALAVERTCDPALGLHLAQFARPGAFGLVEYLGRTAANLLDGARRVSEFGRINHDRVGVQVEEVGACVHVVHAVADGALQPPEVVDFVAAYFVVIGRQLTGRDTGLREVRLARPRPAQVAEYEQFFRAELVFAAPRSVLVLDAALARKPLPAADRQLHALLRRQAEQELAALPPLDEFVANVRAALRETLDSAGGCAGEVARRLGTSERTLRRRLAVAGTNHSSLLEGVRRELALQLEARSDGPQIDMALELGYASASSYRRAFRRWTGTTPGEWRRRNQPSRLPRRPAADV
jgi:AraC-like DNA-binding protein